MGWSSSFIQSDMKFTAHIQRKLITANQQLGIIKRALYWAPTNAKLLAYKTLPPSFWVCSSCLGHKQQERHIRHRTTPRPSSAVYSWIKGMDGAEDAKTRLRLIPLHKRRRGQRLRLLMRILAKEERHSSLSESYNEIMNNLQRLWQRDQRHVGSQLPFEPAVLSTTTIFSHEPSVT